MKSHARNWRLGGYVLAAFVALAACSAKDSGGSTNTTPCDTSGGMSVQPLEWVGYHTEVPLNPADFHALASGMFGADAQAGHFIKEREIAPKVFVKAQAEPSTPDQARLTFAFDDGVTKRRVLAIAPASFQLGTVFVQTVDVALATMQADNAKEPGSGEEFLLEYRVHSAQGGTLSFGVRGNQGAYSLVLDISTPRTSLEPNKIGTAADDFEPYDTVAGTVWFHMSKDDFDYFVDHAYGKGATSKQNFSDFALVPHNWLRLTVDPHLDKKFVDVGFEVLTKDGKRIPVAKAPASVLAGSDFAALVDTNMSTMLAQEQAKPGSSTPWKVPFYYDDPNGGGVVQVIAQGEAGQFSVAYSIESPQNKLMDVPFAAYQDVKIPPPDPTQTASCEQLGNKPAPKGVFDITFTASDVLKNSTSLPGPLKGDLLCSVFHADDVTITGPNPGAVSVQDFTVPGADLQAATPPTFTTDAFFAGKYQILCAQDLDGSGDASKGDPVTLPIGGFEIACDKNPVTVEFALLDPG